MNKLKEKIDKALDKVQRIISLHPDAVLSEADLERLVGSCISRQLHSNVKMKPSEGCFTVHSQISHYNDDSEVDARVDLIILKEAAFIPNPNVFKGFTYDDEAFVIELKYMHHYNEKALRDDFGKREKYEDNTYLYVVALFDEKSDEIWNKRVEFMKKLNDDDKHLYSRALRKDKYAEEEDSKEKQMNRRKLLDNINNK